MTFHIQAVEELIAAVRSNQAFQQVQILVGGYPFNLEQNLWKQISANAYASDAKEAIRVSSNLVK